MGSCECTFALFGCVSNLGVSPTLSYQRLRTNQVLSDEELYTRIKKTVPNKHDAQILEAFLIFNK